MSPIGRVFIVLNLALAGGFAVVSGTYLQKQDNFKKQLIAEQAAHQADKAAAQEQITRLEDERNTFENAKTANETQLLQAQNLIARVQDENKRLSQLTSDQAADIKKLTSLAEQNNTNMKSALADARKAYEASIEAGRAKDDAVRAKDAAEAENRTLKTTIASLNETVDQKDLAIAALERDNSEQKLLVAAAVANGFSPAMAAPTLAGTVTNASDRLLTISIADNPGEVDIQDQINRRPFRFAIYDENGFKAEAVATKYEPTANAVLCNVMFKKGSAQIRTGDRASTKP